MALTIDVISDVVCPWCFIGKRRLEEALAIYARERPEAEPPQVTWRPFQLNPALPAGKAGERRGRGIAVHESFRSVVAQVAEVTVASDGSLKVDRVVCAVDCGTAINPDNIRSQVEGGIGFALSAVLHGEITLKDGKVEQGNFDGYAPLRINEMPAVEVHIVPSAEAPTGIGEPGVPPLAPAVANAIAAATGKYQHRLPLRSSDLVA